MSLLPIKLPIQSPPLPLAMVQNAIERISSQPPKRPPAFDCAGSDDPALTSGSAADPEDVYSIDPPQ